MKILVIDDSRSSLNLIAHFAAQVKNVEVETFLDPVAAMARCAETQFDLVLVDYMMPRMNGVEVVAALRASLWFESVPIVMVTSQIEQSVRRDAIAAGATDFINKPFDTVEFCARLRNLLALRRAQLALADKAQWLANEVEAATRHLAAREEELLDRLGRAIEYRDGSTGSHVSRVALISQAIAEGLGLGPDLVRTIYLGAPLHDIGKIGIPDAILGKPGRLDPDELALMRQHVVIGGKILANGTSDLLRVAENIAKFHHERWDGKGYPEGLAGEAIPIEARIVSVADVFDALCSERPYKPAWPVEQAYKEILANGGTQFDPACVAAFETKWGDIQAILERQADAAA